MNIFGSFLVLIFLFDFSTVYASTTCDPSTLDKENKRAYKKHYRLAKKYYLKRKYRAAFLRYQHLVRICPSDTVILGRARVLDKLKKNADAYSAYLNYVKRVGTKADPQILLKIKNRIEILSKKVARVDAMLLPAHLELKVDGEIVRNETKPKVSPSIKYSIVLEPGLHMIEAKAKGFQTKLENWVVSADRRHERKVQLTPIKNK